MIRFRGVKELWHRRPVAYYDDLLGKVGKKKAQNLMVGDEANPDERVINIAKYTPTHSLSQPTAHPVPALLDRQEGDPEPDEIEEANIGHGRMKVILDADAKEVNDAGAIHDFKPFAFVRAQRPILKGPRAGQVAWTCQVTCPFHRDENDNEMTFCRRAMRFNGPIEEAEVILRLKMWCIRGRGSTSRAIHPTGHKFVNVQHDELLTNKVLRRQLAEGLAAATWITGDSSGHDVSDNTSEETT